METSLFQTFGPYQTAAQNKTLCHVSESEIQDSPGDHFGTSHGFFYAIIFKTLSKESIQLPFMKVQKKCLLLQNWECVQPWKSTHVSNVNLVLVCVHFYIIFQILRSSLTLILFFSSLLCWHQLVPFFSSPYTAPSLLWVLSSSSATLSCSDNCNLFPFNHFLPFSTPV